MVRLVHEHDAESWKVRQTRVNTLDSREGDPLPEARDFRVSQLVGWHALGKLIPESSMQLFDDRDSVSDHKDALTLNARISEQVGDQLGHNHRLAESCSENDLAAASIQKGFTQRSSGFSLVRPQDHSTGRIVRCVRHPLPQ